MDKVGERGSAGRRRGQQWLGLILLLCALAAGVSCGSFPGPVPVSHLLPSDSGSSAQEGEVTLRDGDEAVVRYKKTFMAPPRLVVVEFRQSWFKDRPYAKSDFQLLDQTAAGFRVVNNHPEADRGSTATIKWRAEGVLAAVQPAPPPPGIASLAQKGPLTQEQLVEAVKRLGGTVGFDMGSPISPRPIAIIDLHHTKVTDADLEQLRSLNRLRVLTLSGTGISDEGLKSVGGLPALQTLHLNETRVGDAGLPHLQRLTELRELSLYHTRVTDDGLANLKTLSNLRDLTLSGPHVTDRGVMQLTGLRNLKHLNLSQTGVSKAGIQGLKKALPKVEVIQ